MSPMFKVIKGNPNPQEVAALTMLVAAGAAEKENSEKPAAVPVVVDSETPTLQRSGLPGFAWN